MKVFAITARLILCLLPCVFFIGCTSQNGGAPEAPSAFSLSPDAVIDVVETERTQIETTASSAVINTEAPEVIVTGAIQPSQTPKKPKEDTAPAKTYNTVKFVDSDGYTALAVQSVEAGRDALPPQMPQKKDGLTFQGWNKDYTRVSQNMIVTAIYAEKTYTVSFYDINGALLKEAKVPYGGSASAPAIAKHRSVVFEGWSEMVDEVTADVSTYATYALPDGKNSLTLAEAYADNLVVCGETVDGFEAGRYFSDGIMTVGDAVYSDVLCGNFEDRMMIANYGFSRFAGTLVHGGAEDCSVTLSIECDGKRLFEERLDAAGERSFSVPVAGASIVRIKLGIERNGVLQDLADPTAVGGIANARFEN